jgi:ornithine cyclodeaminase/alanine dehydrogenase-like protein (mu-crystallin family)
MLVIGKSDLERLLTPAATLEAMELVTGAKPGRKDREEITLFKSVGFALEDAAAARLAYDLARAAGVGVEVDLG